jgi:cytochrome c biogenesis protein CcdA/thiol-disulfide isomerase/thioredoxin
MQGDIINLGLGFLEGLALIVSPCILPILPIILAGSLSGKKNRPIGIIIGFISIFSLFTYFSRKLVLYTGIDLNVIRHLSFAILLLIGIIMLSTYLTKKFSQITGRLAGIGSTLGMVNNPQGGVVSGILFGGLVAIIWTPCAGPILAAVIVQAVVQQTNVMSFLVLVAFGLGAAVPMLIIALFGRRVIDKFSYLKPRASLLRKLLGLIIILTVFYMITLEGGINRLQIPAIKDKPVHGLENNLLRPYSAPEISGIDAWINSTPLQISDLRGKIVLIDFWTYSCINCLRTLPYIKDWYNKYHDKGLVIIGVHTPEFEFEKSLSNVKYAVEKYGIQYPVALDSHFVTWLNFSNSYWPAHYLIDKKGNVVYTHFGEGDYNITENNIRYLLGMGESAPKKIEHEDLSFSATTPETYLGYARANDFSSNERAAKDESVLYTFPKELTRNSWALQGKWQITAEKIISAQPNVILKINFYAPKVYIVMGNQSENPIVVKLLLNGKNVIAEKGKDVSDSSIIVNKHTLYEAVSLDHTTSGILQVMPSSPGLEVYTFTFGS